MLVLACAGYDYQRRAARAVTAAVPLAPAFIRAATIKQNGDLRCQSLK
jgi:hypothetical protein